MSVTARQLTDRIFAEIGCEPIDETVDTFKAGDPDAEVTGVATTFLATLDVLRRAAVAGLNFVITHEPTFYHHRDETAELEGDAVPAAAQIRLLQRDDVEILVAGEAREWEAVEYVRDAADAGFRKAMILLGHCASEEAGMNHLAEWLRPLLPSVRIEYLPAGDPFISA